VLVRADRLLRDDLGRSRNEAIEVMAAGVVALCRPARGGRHLTFGSVRHEIRIARRADDV
jgi:hypothetical protein